MKLKQSEGLIKRLPGFGSGQWWKSLLASGGYLIIFFICIGLLLPTTPSLALEFVDPTNKDSVSISGKTNADKSVTLIQEGGVIDSINADSSGQFYFVLNNLPEGSFSYQIEVCNSGKKRQCVTKSLLIEIDKTSPNMPLIALPNQLPEIAGDEAIFKGKAEPGSIITVQIGSQQIEGIKADESGEFEIKTGLDLGVNTIKIQAIDKVGNKSETYSSEVEYNPVKQKVKVTRIIDGDTIEIQTGEKIRYIGVNTPETNECYFNQAKDKNTSLVKDKEVILEKDVSETDRYQRLLRYVWLDGQLINEVLVKEGYAQAATYPPDVKYQARFLEAQAWAREQTRGLWGEVCNPNQKSSNDSQVQGVSTYQEPEQASDSVLVAGCDCSKACSQMSSCEEAYYQLNQCGCSARDGDKDGVPCESLCSGTSITTQTIQTQPVQSVPPATNTSGAYTCNCSKTCPNMSSCDEAQYQLNVCGCKQRDGDKDGIACDAAPLHCQN